MSKRSEPHPVHASELPPSFRRIRMELAREPGHPMGSAEFGYTLLAPLGPDGRIDAKAWDKHRDACRVVRFRPGEEDDIGHLIRKRGGSWALSYDISGDEDDEAGYRFNDERFEVGEYISIKDDDGVMHTYRVVSVERV